MRILQDIKVIIERHTDASSETETKTLNTTNNTMPNIDASFDESMEGANNSVANMATTNKAKQIQMTKKTEEERVKKNNDVVQHNSSDKTEKRNSESVLMHDGMQ